ncbi:hypothetical protein SAMN05660199_03198 [Klenkia soli]|uniref:Uncharacterized protein n=2 Tax=Klenkia soli TaxID=1052260 RepID=A0A1H0Q5B5_9ACTN|nr:hypothetical protein SAMN05660199_03198 [Klenkia soli]
MGLSVRQVQRLMTDGALTRIGTDRIEAISVEQWLAQRPTHRVRAWAEPTAWAAVALLEGQKVDWVDQPRRSRLRTALVDATPAEVVARTRDRARVRRYFAHPQAHSWLSGLVVSSGALTATAGLSAASEHERVDGYVSADEVLRLVIRFRMEHDPGGHIVLRETTMPIDLVRSLARGRQQVLAGLDLAGSTDDRERAAGRQLIASAQSRLGDRAR